MAATTTTATTTTTTTGIMNTMEIDGDFNPHGFVSILSKKSPPRRLHEWILYYKAYDFWESLCSNEVSVLSSKHIQDAVENGMDPLDIPLKNIETKLVDDIIRKYQEAVTKRKMSVSVTSNSGNKIVLDVHNIVMGIDLKQMSDKKGETSETVSSSILCEDENNTLDSHHNMISFDEMHKMCFGETGEIKDVFGDYVNLNESLCKHINQQAFEELDSGDSTNISSSESIWSRSSTYNSHTTWPWSSLKNLLQKRIDVTRRHSMKNPRMEKDRENPLVAFVKSEKMTFNAFLHYMIHSVKDPSFLRSSNMFNIFSEHKQREKFIHSEEEEKDEDEEEEEHVIDEIVNDIDKRLEEDLMEDNSMDVDEENEKLDKTARKSHIPTTPTTTKEPATINSSSSSFEQNFQFNYADREKYNALPKFRLNLQSYANATSKLGSQYNPRKFASVSCRSDFFPLTLDIFPHGSISSTGSHHEIASILAFQKILNDLREIYGPLAFEDPYVKLSNLVLSGNVGYEICPGLLTHYYPSYFREIQKFIGTAYVDRNRTDKSTVLLFRRGSVCYAGATSFESVRDNMKPLSNMLETCKATPENLLREQKLYNTDTTPIHRSLMSNTDRPLREYQENNDYVGGYEGDSDHDDDE